VESLPENRLSVNVDNNQILSELAAFSQNIAVLIEDDAVAVENQLVLPADGVHVRDYNAMVYGARVEHLVAKVAFASVERRRTDVDDQFRISIRLGRRRPARVPDVLANVDAEIGAAELDDGARAARLEVAILIEHAVVRQEDLVVHGSKKPIMRYGGRVVDV
jgi:hypothetical protein